jgi:pyruvate carboxylase subunit A
MLMKKMFHKILIANRGEIALRIIRTCREMGIRTVAVYSDVDADAPYVKHTDEAYPLGNPEPIHSYLNIEGILNIAERAQVDAIHPGYGFLAESPAFVEACEARGLTFVGPPPTCMHRAKPKHKSRQLMQMMGIPVAPGSEDAIGDNPGDMAKAFEIAEDIGYPVIIKPTGSGGGIGMGIVENRDELAKAMEYAASRGGAIFGTPAFYIEKYFPNIKHIEFQVLADKKGNVIHLGERECSVQRRFQKLIEEAPSAGLTPELRVRMGILAIEIAMALHYISALTVEFIYIPDTGEFYFNEVNCRLQVEHTLTELITGIDIVKEQMRIAAGEKLSYTQNDIPLWGWAIECRINAEDPCKNFIPSPTRITDYQPPAGFGIRVDSGVCAGYTIPYQYDPLMVKLLSWGRDRDEAISRMSRALDEFVIDGVKTTIPFHKCVMKDEQFRKGNYTTNFIQERGILTKLQGGCKDRNLGHHSAGRG